MKSGNEPTWSEESEEPDAPEPRAQRGATWKEAPLELWAFVVFSIAVVLADWGMRFVAQAAYESLIQYVGWVPSGIYMFSIFPGIQLLVRRNAGMRFVLILMMGLGVAHGLVDVFRLADRHPSGNPYLDVSPYRPVWTIAVPLLWGLILLFSPRIKRYCQPPAPRA